MSASRRGSTQKAVAFLACAAAVAVAGALVYSMRVELFVVPARWREVKRAMEAEDGEALQPALRDLLRAQVPGLSPDGEGDVMLRGFKPSGGGELYLVGYWREEARELFLFLFLFLLDARGRVAGGRAPVEMPERVWIDQEDFASDGWVKAVLHEPTHRFFYRPSPDGLVPHGFLLRGPAEDQSPESTLVPLSTAVSIPARIWLLRDRRPPPSPERARKLLSGRRAIDLYRGLEEAERLGPAGAALALPLLEHPDPDLRARAAAVCGNDPERGAALRPLLEDPAKQVRLAAALALLASRDLEAGRAALTLVLRERCGLLIEGLEVDVAP
ncbi:MAG: hypothetical protein HY721_22855, partial [Planctomycetes bacterium]|nr:hypothetical protein [Planctomycetota bacterium]